MDIDQLDQSTLLSLYRFVCPAPPGAKRSANRRSGGGTTKRKNLDENKESERIEMLEARLRDFEGSGQADESRRGSAVGGGGGGGGDRASSDSSSEEGSESESEQSD